MSTDHDGAAGSAPDSVDLRSDGDGGPDPRAHAVRGPARAVVHHRSGGDAGAAPAPPGREPEVMDAQEAADFLRFSLSHLKELAEAGEVPGWKIRRNWRFSRRALLAEMGWVENG